VTEASDVYGLGATLYAVLTGRPPFRGKTVAETLHQVKYRDPVPPRRVNPAVDKDLDTIIFYCLEKNPKKRYGSAAEVAQELKRYLDGRPLKRRPLGPVGRAGRWCRRNPAVASLSAAAVVLLTLASVLSVAYSSVFRWGTEASRNADRLDVEATEARNQEKARAYLQDIPRAQQHVNAGDLTEASKLLAKYVPAEDEKDHRAWDWYFLSAQCREKEFSVRRHAAAVLAVAWNPDGKRLASADGQGVVKVWDVNSAEELPELRTRDGVFALAWNPDGKRLATASKDGQVMVWDTADGGKPLTLPAAEIPKPANAPPFAFRRSWTLYLHWSANGQKLALVDADGAVQIWDTAAVKKPVVLHDPDCLRGIQSAAWSPVGSRLALTDGDAQIRVWDADKGAFTGRFRASDLPAGMGNMGITQLSITHNRHSATRSREACR
jgi:hypothetical protein